MGKIHHRRDAASWSEPKWIPPADIYPIYSPAESLERQRHARATSKPDDWWGQSKWIKDAADVPDAALFDGQLARKAVDVLRNHGKTPFFLAVGFFRPHLPFIVPQRYYDRYPLEMLRLTE